MSPRSKAAAGAMIGLLIFIPNALCAAPTGLQDLSDEGLNALHAKAEARVNLVTQYQLARFGMVKQTSSEILTVAYSAFAQASEELEGNLTLSSDRNLSCRTFVKNTKQILDEIKRDYISFWQQSNRYTPESLVLRTRIEILQLLAKNENKLILDGNSGGQEIFSRGLKCNFENPR